MIEIERIHSNGISVSPCAFGLIDKYVTDAAPALCPKTVIADGSPPKFLMLS